MMIAAFVAVAAVAEAKITLRPDTPHGNFYFHGNYSTTPFDPASRFAIAVWNCADGTAPLLLALPVPLVVCSPDDHGDFDLGQLAYTVEVPPGACVDHGASCYFRDRSVPRERAGIRYFRVRYAKNGIGNRVWLDGYGDLAAATHARMLIVISIDGLPRASLNDTFTPRRSGGWFSPF